MDRGSEAGLHTDALEGEASVGHAAAQHAVAVAARPAPPVRLPAARKETEVHPAVGRAPGGRDSLGQTQTKLAQGLRRASRLSI